MLFSFPSFSILFQCLWTVALTFVQASLYFTNGGFSVFRFFLLRDSSFLEKGNWLIVSLNSLVFVTSH